MTQLLKFPVQRNMGYDILELPYKPLEVERLLKDIEAKKLAAFQEHGLNCIACLVIDVQDVLLIDHHYSMVYSERILDAATGKIFLWDIPVYTKPDIAPEVDVILHYDCNLRVK